MNRVEGRDKVTGRATYAYEYPAENTAYVYPVQSSIARGHVRSVESGAARAMPGVLAVLSSDDPPDLRADVDAELTLLQTRVVAYYGQIVAAVVADSLEIAREAAAAIEIGYDTEPHDVRLRSGPDRRPPENPEASLPDDPYLYTPEKVNPSFPTTTSRGDINAGLARAHVTVDRTYTTPPQHNNPMEPHAAIAAWDAGGRLTVWNSTQGPSVDRDTIAKVLDLPPERVRVISRHVGGGFGAKGTTRPHAILAAVAARAVGRPVKIAVTRQQMFDFTGYRTPTIQRMRLGADADGRLTAISHEVVEQTSMIKEFAEQTATPTRVMYGPGPLHDAPAGPPERAHAVVDARARRMPGHVRAGVGDGRTGSRRRD